MFRFLVLVWLGLVVGCSFTPIDPTETVVFPDNYMKNHFIYVDYSGEALRIDRPGHRLRDDDGESPYEAHLEEIRKQIERRLVATEGPLDLVVYAHGGLVGGAAVIERNRELCQQILDDGKYPLFIVWPGDWPSTYRDHMFYVKQGTDVREKRFYEELLAYLTFPFYIVADTGKAVARYPITFSTQFSNDFHTIPGLESKLWDNSLKAYEVLYEEMKAKPGETLTVHLGPQESSNWRSVGHGVSYFLTLPVKIFSVFAIDAYGTSSWDVMKRRTELLFWRSRDYYDRNKQMEGKHEETGALGKLARWLSNYASEQKRLQITLIGHSMGTIILNDFLRAAPELEAENIVYMGAACTLRDFRGAVVPHLRRHREAHFYNLMLHPNSEKSELGFLDLWQRGSLLVWIDNFLGKPNDFLDRTLGQWVNVINAHHIIPDDIRKRVTLRGFGHGNGDPQRHGDFDTDGFWKREYREAPAKP